MTEQTFPDIIKSLPRADVSIPGVKAWLAQGLDFQIVFFEIKAGVEIPPHHHKAQFGIVIDGELSLTIDTKTKLYQKGESYFIPEGAIHGGTFQKFSRVMDFFSEPKRYKPKK